MRLFTLVASLALCAWSHAAQASDPRASTLVTLDGEHAWSFAGDAPAWELEAQRIRRQVQVSAGLWPMPERGPLRAVIRGEVDRGEYKVQAILLETVPGFFLGGNLYLPAKRDGLAPAVLCPHGHWNDGRFCRRSDAEVADELASGAEKDADAARFHLQARCVQLARMGCIVFFYDMVGCADTLQLGHGEGFVDLESLQWGESAFGLQTWNSLRALDWLAAVPGVDPARIGVTGESGGGTQTFILCALDPRPAVAFPAVMVSTAMQGGCICENAPHLRVGINNVAIAALTAPRPMELSGADDWTREIETRGLPELHAVYALLGAPERVAARCWPQFGHNYNLHAREEMERWFDRHLALGAGEQLHETSFVPVEPAELSALGKRGALPAQAKSGVVVRALLRDEAEMRFKRLLPKIKADAERYRAVVEPALEVLLHTTLASVEPVSIAQAGSDLLQLQASDGGPPVAATLFAPAKPNGTLCIVVSRSARADLADTLAKGFAQGVTYLQVHTLLDDAPAKAEKLRLDERHDSYAGYTWGYNRVLIAERARDVLVAIAAARQLAGTQRVILWGEGRAGRPALLAAALGRRHLDAVLVDANWDFGDIERLDDPDLLPGALRYGGLDGFAALILPVALQLAQQEPRQTWPATSAMRAALGEGSSFSPRPSSELIGQLLERR